MKQGDLRCNIKVCYIVYPRGETFGVKPGTWCVFGAEVTTVLEGKPVLNRSGLIRVAGEVPSLDRDKEYSLTARLSDNPKYSNSYDILRMNELKVYTSREEQEEFLKLVLSENQIEALYSNLDNPFETIKNHDIATLCTIKGIKEYTAQKIIQKYEESVDDGPAFLELFGYGLSKLTIRRLIDQYKSANTLLEKVKDNPYILIDEVTGIGWSKADKIAMNSGVGQFSKKRIAAYIKYYLNQQAENGNSWVEVADIVSAAKKELTITEEHKALFREAIQTMAIDNIVWLSENHRYAALVSVRKLELHIAKELKRISDAEVLQPQISLEAGISQAENELGIEYTDEQRDAIKKIVQSNVSILTGFGGTGKTTVVSGVLKVLQGMSFAQTALSGRAAARMSEVTYKDGYTIHRLLGYKPESGFKYNASNQLSQQIIILDETSMVGADLFYHLIQAIPSGSRLIMIGDDGQLESIGMCNIFKDMLNSGVIPVARLTKIHRQAAKSAIITESIKVRRATQLTPFGWAGQEVRGELKDLELDIYRNAADSYSHIMAQFNRLYQNAGMDCSDIQIVLPQRFRGNISTLRINLAVQAIVNPPQGQDEVQIHYIAAGTNVDYMLRVGDSVIINRNNYDTVTADGVNCPVYNGNKGTVVSIDKELDAITIDFEQWGKIVIPHYNDKNLNVWNTIELAYALTCHKLQGSEAKYVIVGMDNTAHVMLTREWLYTAITRAKKFCVICAESDALNYSIKNSNVPYKQTFLCDFLKKIFLKEISKSA